MKAAYSPQMCIRDSKSEDLEEMALAGTARLKHFFRYMGLPVSFKELGIEHHAIDRMLVSLRRNKVCLLYTSRCV